MNANGILVDLPVELALFATEAGQELSALPPATRYLRGVALFEILAAKLADGRAPGNMLDPQPMALCVVVAAIAHSFALSHGENRRGTAGSA